MADQLNPNYASLLSNGVGQQYSLSNAVASQQSLGLGRNQGGDIMNARTGMKDIPSMEDHIALKDRVKLLEAIVIDLLDRANPWKAGKVG